jgi:predicted DNA-binding ribbon-helix-helix protein
MPDGGLQRGIDGGDAATKGRPEYYGFTVGQGVRHDDGAQPVGGVPMKSPVVKRSIVLGGHKTSVSLEEAFWIGMKEVAGQRSMTLSELVGEIDTNRHQSNLSSAIRLFVLDYFRSRAMGSTGGSQPHSSHAEHVEAQ